MYKITLISTVDLDKISHVFIFVSGQACTCHPSACII